MSEREPLLVTMPFGAAASDAKKGTTGAMDEQKKPKSLLQKFASYVGSKLGTDESLKYKGDEPPVVLDWDQVMADSRATKGQARKLVANGIAVALKNGAMKP